MGNNSDHNNTSKAGTADSVVLNRPAAEKFISPHPSVISQAPSKSVQMPGLVYLQEIETAKTKAAFGDHATAIEHYKGAFAIKGSVVSTADDHCKHGESHLALGQTKEAIYAFKTALHKDSDHISSYKGLISSYELMRSQLSPDDQFTTATLNQYLRPLITKLGMLQEAEKSKLSHNTENSAEKPKSLEPSIRPTHESEKASKWQQLIKRVIQTSAGHEL